MSQQINLFNPRFRKEKRHLTAPALAMIVGVALAGSIALAMAAQGRVNQLEAESAELKAVLAEAEARKTTTLAGLVPRPKDAAVSGDLGRAEVDQRALRGVTEILEQNRVGDPRGYSAYFQALARARVGGLWLTGVDIGGAQADIGLRGRALRAELLPGYLSGLAREPALRGKAFERVEIVRPGAPAAPAAPGAGAPPPDVAAEVIPVMAPYVEFSLQGRTGVAP